MDSPSGPTIKGSESSNWRPETDAEWGEKLEREHIEAERIETKERNYNDNFEFLVGQERLYPGTQQIPPEKEKYVRMILAEDAMEKAREKWSSSGGDSKTATNNEFRKILRKYNRWKSSRKQDTDFVGHIGVCVRAATDQRLWKAESCILSDYPRGTSFGPEPLEACPKCVRHCLEKTPDLAFFISEVEAAAERMMIGYYAMTDLMATYETFRAEEKLGIRGPGWYGFEMSPERMTSPDEMEPEYVRVPTTEGVMLHPRDIPEPPERRILDPELQMKIAVLMRITPLEKLDAVIDALSATNQVFSHPPEPSVSEIIELSARTLDITLSM